MTLRGMLANVRSRRFIYLCFRLVGALLNLLPRRLVFWLLVLCDSLELKGRIRLYQAYFPYVMSHLVGHPEFRFATSWNHRFKSASARVLHGIGAYREASDWILDNGLTTSSPDVSFALLKSLFELGEFDKAHAAAIQLEGEDLSSAPHLAYLKAMLDIIAGDEPAALDSMAAACAGDPAFFRPHQNIAARSPKRYVPNSLDHFAGAAGRLFDLCNFAGQRVIHVGRGEVGTKLYGRALDAQRQLRDRGPPKLSPALGALLDELGASLHDLWLIPEEWSTQIGHLGMLDILLRMRDLGWWSGMAILVVRPGQIANPAFFHLFDGAGKLVVLGDMLSEQLGDELLSLQRWYGLNFNAFPLPDGNVVPWQDAGALAMQVWEQQGRGHPLRNAYDRIYGGAGPVNDAFQRLRDRFGMKQDDWYVCLHTRDAAHYLEFSGTGQTHRNAPIEASLDAIRFITAQGGWVIKLGGPRSPKLPPIERTIDYALSDLRSDLMDIHLIRHARAFIGTTSGLTNVAVSFGIPSAIVNAISTDAQLWNSNVRFAPKPVRVDGAMLTQWQLTSSPWRWRLFDAAVLGRSGGHPSNNSSDEILETVKEVHALAIGRSGEFEAQYPTDQLLSQWRAQLGEPYYYGASRPSLYYLKKYAREFLAGGPQTDVGSGPLLRVANGGRE